MELVGAPRAPRLPLRPGARGGAKRPGERPRAAEPPPPRRRAGRPDPRPARTNHVAAAAGAVYLGLQNAYVALLRRVRGLHPQLPVVMISGDEAVKVITDWVEAHSDWNESLLIVSADHGHYLVIVEPESLTGRRR